MGRCCCGKFDLDPIYGPEVTHNDYTHQILGPKENFCGPAYLHLEKKLRTRIAELEAELEAHRVAVETMNKTSISVELYDDVVRKNERLRKALTRLSEYKIYDIDVIAKAALAAEEG